MSPILRSSATDFVLNPINAATEFIGSTGLAAVFFSRMRVALGGRD